MISEAANQLQCIPAQWDTAHCVHVSSRSTLVDVRDFIAGYRLAMASIVQYFKSIPTHMDYDGQARAEKLSRVIITLFGVVGLIWGYVIQQFSQTLYILSAGFVMAAIITIPAWPMYRRNPLDWQKSQSDAPAKSKKKK